MTKQFAPEYPRTDEGWIRFPVDSDYRKRIFPFLDLSAHPAKANLYMLQACIEYVSEPEQLILDPMAGTGSILVATLVGRRVMCMEIEKEYQDIILQGIQCIDEIAPGASNQLVFIPSDCRLVMPIPADHIIFSPPYGNILRKKCYDSLPAGGTLTIIIKNHIEQGVEINFSGQARDDCLVAGFEEHAWHKWIPPGSAYTSFMRARGDKVVDLEDIVIMKKGGN